MKKRKRKSKNISDFNNEEPHISLIAYKEDDYVEIAFKDFHEINYYLQTYKVVWLNIDCCSDIETVEKVGEIFKFHRLALEDVVNTDQRTKIEHYNDYHFIVTRMLVPLEVIETEQLSIFFGSNYIVTFQDKPGDTLDHLRTRLRHNRGNVRALAADHLLYEILDTVIDAYFPVLEKFGEKVDDLEDNIFEKQSDDSISLIHEIKRDLITMRRAVWPLREVINSLIRDSNSRVSDETKIFLRDCYDHTVRIIDLAETYRELCSDLMDLYLSIISNKMNEVMKMLTIISTIFIPLTFIVGVYGMNFNPESSPWNMPELNSYYGYPAVMLFMLVIAVALLRFFKRKGWL